MDEPASAPQWRSNQAQRHVADDLPWHRFARFRHRRERVACIVTRRRARARGWLHPRTTRQAVRCPVAEGSTRP